MSAWIKCSERMPGSAEAVLVWTIFRDTQTAVWNGKEWRTHARYVGGSGWGIAWQPLPEPPSDQAAEESR